MDNYININTNINLVFQIALESKIWEPLPQRLRNQIKNIISLCLTSRADSTTKRYLSHIQKFLKWLHDNKLTPNLPLPSTIIATYLSHLVSQQQTSVSTLSIVYPALKWFQSFVPGNYTSFSDPCCKNIIESHKRNSTKPNAKKEPISAEIIKAVTDKFGTSDASLNDLRIATLFTLGFSGFFRFNELSNIQCNHISFSKDCASIHVPHSKTDIYREGNKVFIARTKTNYCPVSILERYLAAIGGDPSSSTPIFRGIRKKKSGYECTDKKLSYTRCREIFKETLENLNYDSRIYGLHSLRSGGATAAVNNTTTTPISERLLKLHGRWKTDGAKDRYVKESQDSRLSVSRNLGL